MARTRISSPERGKRSALVERIMRQEIAALTVEPRHGQRGYGAGGTATRMEDRART
jgi:hypothetical protein